MPELEAALAEVPVDVRYKVKSGAMSLAGALGYNDQKMLKLVETGGRLLKNGRYDEARKIFRGLVALDPSVPLFHQGLGMCARLTGDLDAALEATNTAIARAGEVEAGEDILAGALLERATLYAARRDTEPAKRDLRRALALPKGALSKPQRLQCKELLRGLG